MVIRLKNKHIYFGVESVWNQLDYKFKYQLNQLCTVNSDEETEQDVEVSIDVLKTLINAVNNQPQGIAREINPEMFVSVLQQLQKEAAKGDEEAIQMLQLVQEMAVINDDYKNKKIASGKEQVLA